MNTIKRTVKTLKLLAEHPLRFTDIVRELQLIKSTAQRLLKALEQTELIKKNPLSGRYHLGPLISQLAAFAISEHQFLISLSIEELRKLRDLSGETASLQIPLGTERICLEEIQNMESIKYVSGRGTDFLTGRRGKDFIRKHVGLFSFPNSSFLEKNGGSTMCFDLCHQISQMAGTGGLGEF